MTTLSHYDTLRIPTYWASLFVNGDPAEYTLHDPVEVEAFNRFCEDHPSSRFVLEWGSEEYFSWRPHYLGLGATCVDVEVYERIETAE